MLAVVALVNEPAEANDCIYVGGEKGISVIGADSASVVATIPAAVGRSIAIDRARLLAYVAGYAVLVVDLRTNTVVASVPWPCPLLGSAQQFVLSPDGSRLYVFVGNTLLVVDTMSRTVTMPPVNLHANNGEPLMDITPDGKFLYVARPPFGVTVVDTATFTITAEVSGFPYGAVAYSVVVAPDGKRAYTLDPGNTVSVIDTATNTVTDRIEITHCRRVGDIDKNCGTVNLAISPDGRYVYVVNYVDESIGAIDTRTNTELYYTTSVYPIRLADPTSFGAPEMHPLFMAVSPDGQTFAVTHDYFDRDLPRPNFLWIVQYGFGAPVSFSQSHAPVFSNGVLAIASVPSGCAGKPIACVGDCDGLGTVTVDELVEGVTMALGEQPVATCVAFDANRDDAVTIDELVRGVHNALTGCTAETPTPIIVPVCPSLTPTLMPTQCNGCPPTPTPTRTFPP
ncbi:MAG: hypothetical protein HYR72_18695 [Deltaproteobacteria bacterium]|nr:hypothetical protein [Deltaproteobacteria bacterium]MBI3386249.1 hypothetical protein [Deltaproteobacteria bacterium]